jgi:hypothetical protein
MPQSAAVTGGNLLAVGAPGYLGPDQPLELLIPLLAL